LNVKPQNDKFIASKESESTEVALDFMLRVLVLLLLSIYCVFQPLRGKVDLFLFQIFLTRKALRFEDDGWRRKLII